MKWRSSNFKHLEIDADNWIGMNLVQRDSHIKCCLNIPLDRIAKSRYAEPEVVECDLCCLSVSYQDCDGSFSASSFAKNGIKPKWQMVK